MCRHPLYNEQDMLFKENEGEDDTTIYSGMDSDEEESDIEEEEQGTQRPVREPAIERQDFELDARQQFQTCTEEQINGIPELYLETVYETLVQRGITMMDLIVMNYTGLTSKSDKYNTTRKRRNVDIMVNNIINEIDNEMLEGYAMSMEDVTVEWKPGEWKPGEYLLWNVFYELQY